MAAPEQASFVLGHTMTPETVREVMRQASAVHWGTHLLRWRSCDVTHAGMTSHRDALVPTALWHLRKRRDVEQAWPPDTTLEHLTYYGYVADLEGSGVGVLDLLFVRDTIQAILRRLTPDEALPTSLYACLDDLDAFLRAERRTCLMVVGQEE